jgi:uncharacterized protein involved in type VI secretion and phage assembly
MQMRTCLARVVDIDDPDGLSRVKIRLLNFAGADSQDGETWARVAVAFAGPDNGSYLIPDVGAEVLVTFVNDDPRQPVVVGSLWNGAARPAETPGDGGHIDRWAIKGRAGTRIAIEEPAAGSPTIKLTTPDGVSAEITDEGGGKIQCRAAGTTITVDPAGVRIDCPSRVEVNAAQVQVTAGMVQVDAAMSSFNGVVRCDTLITTTVIASTYTPGAGNVW